VIAVGQVVHRPVEPFTLVLRIGTDYATFHDLLEHLVAGFVKRSYHRRDAPSISILTLLH